MLIKPTASPANLPIGPSLDTSASSDHSVHNQNSSPYVNQLSDRHLQITQGNRLGRLELLYHKFLNLFSSQTSRTALLLLQTLTDTARPPQTRIQAAHALQALLPYEFKQNMDASVKLDVPDNAPGDLLAYHTFTLISSEGDERNEVLVPETLNRHDEQVLDLLRQAFTAVPQATDNIQAISKFLRIPQVIGDAIGLASEDTRAIYLKALKPLCETKPTKNSSDILTELASNLTKQSLRIEDKYDGIITDLNDENRLEGLASLSVLQNDSSTPAQLDAAATQLASCLKDSEKDGVVGLNHLSHEIHYSAAAGGDLTCVQTIKLRNRKSAQEEEGRVLKTMVSTQSVNAADKKTAEKLFDRLFDHKVDYASKLRIINALKSNNAYAVAEKSGFNGVSKQTHYTVKRLDNGNEFSFSESLTELDKKSAEGKNFFTKVDNILNAYSAETLKALFEKDSARSAFCVDGNTGNGTFLKQKLGNSSYAIDMLNQSLFGDINGGFVNLMNQNSFSVIGSMYTTVYYIERPKDQLSPMKVKAVQTYDIAHLQRKHDAYLPCEQFIADNRSIDLGVLTKVTTIEFDLTSEGKIAMNAATLKVASNTDHVSYDLLFSSK